MNNQNSHSAWTVCIVSSLFFMYHFIQATLFDSISVNLMRTFDLNAYELANLSAAYFYGNILCLLPAGIILDRINTKKILCITLFFLILSNFIFGIMINFKIAFIARLVAGFCGGFAFLSSLKLAMNWFSSDKIPLILGIIITIGFLGGVISHQPIVYLSESFGLNVVFLLLTLLGIIILVLNLKYLKNYSKINEFKKTSNRITIKKLFLQLKEILNNPYVWIGGLFTTFLNLPVLLFGALWGTFYLHQGHHISMDNASLISSLTFIGLIVGTPLVGYYAKTTTRIKQILFLGAIGCCIMLACLILCKITSVIMLGIIFLLLGFFSSTQAVGYSIVITNSNSELVSFASSIMSMLIFGGGTLIKIIFGFILDKNWNGIIADNGVRLYSNTSFNISLTFVEFFFISSIFLAVLYKKCTNCRSS